MGPASEGPTRAEAHNPSVDVLVQHGYIIMARFFSQAMTTTSRSPGGFERPCICPHCTLVGRQFRTLLLPNYVAITCPHVQINLVHVLLYLGPLYVSVKNEASLISTHHVRRCCDPKEIEQEMMYE